MKEKILALLVQKFQGVRKDGLAQMAKILAYQATTEEEAQALVTKLTSEQVTEFVRDYRSEIDREVSSGVKTHEDKLKGEFDFVKKPKTEEPNPEDDKVPAWAKALIEQNKTLANELTAIKSGKTTDVRRSKLEEVLKDTNPQFKAMTLKQFGRMSFETDESFEEFISETQTDAATFTQEQANAGLSGQARPVVGAGVTPKALEADIAAWADKNNPAK